MATYFENKSYLVDSIQFRGPRKTYRINRIEKVSLRRDPAYIIVGIAILLFLFEVKYDLISGWIISIIYFGVLGTVSEAAFKNLGVLFIETKALSEMAAFGDLKTMRAVREAIEKALRDHDTNDDEDEAVKPKARKAETPPPESSSGINQSEKDALDLLGLSKPYTLAELDKRRKAMLLKVHPDHGGSNAMARMVNDAYLLLKDKL